MVTASSIFNQLLHTNSLTTVPAEAMPLLQPLHQTTVTNGVAAMAGMAMPLLSKHFTAAGQQWCPC